MKPWKRETRWIDKWRVVLVEVEVEVEVEGNDRCFVVVVRPRNSTKERNNERITPKVVGETATNKVLKNTSRNSML